MDFGASTRRKPNGVRAFWTKVPNLHHRIVDLDIQLTNGIAGNAQPNPAIT
jgi:hypothetical protein